MDIVQCGDLIPGVGKISRDVALGTKFCSIREASCTNSDTLMAISKMLIACHNLGLGISPICAFNYTFA